MAKNVRYKKMKFKSKHNDTGKKVYQLCNNLRKKDHRGMEQKLTRNVIASPSAARCPPSTVRIITMFY